MSADPALAPHECWALLRTADVGRLAVISRQAPDIFPVNFVVDHGSIVFRTAAGMKLAAASAGPVAFEADGYDPRSAQAWSVVIRGIARRVEAHHEILEAADLPLFPWHGSPKHYVVRVVPDEITGRQFPVVDPARWRTVLSDAARSAPE
jgi:hypothetical protein